jgi:hypothetical protein
MVGNLARQLSLLDETDDSRRSALSRRRDPFRARPLRVTVLCARCRAKEARYGFRDADRIERSSTLCFECFRLELEHRRRRAQIAARRALGPEWP